MSTHEDIERLVMFIDSYKHSLDEFEDKSQVLASDAALLKVVDTLKLTKLSNIELSGQSSIRFNDSDVYVLITAMQRSFIKLTVLKLQHHRISDKGMIQLCQLISPRDDESYLPSLLKLDLEGNDIGEGGCFAIHDCLVTQDSNGKSYCQLLELNLSCNPLSPKGGIALADCLLTNKSLKRLLLANCDFNLKAIMAFSTNLVYNESLEELVLDRPVLFTKQDEGSDHFSRILEHQRSLRALSLRYHDMNDFGATMLSKGLANNSTLTSINLECNGISIIGAAALASLLLQPECRMRTLRLSCNRILDEGACVLAEAIQRNSTLTQLTLKRNRIGIPGLVAIARALEDNNSLRLLALWGNEFDDYAAEMYYKLTASRFRFTGLAMDFEVYVVDGVHMVAEKSLDLV